MVRGIIEENSPETEFDKDSLMDIASGYVIK
jgi:hypothetical protein